MSYQCLICFENCKYPAILDLNCECQYNVHFKCYNKWWKMKKNCMICQTPAGKAISYYKFKDKSNYRFLLDLHHKQHKSNLLTNKNKTQLFKDINHNFKYHFIFFIIAFIIDYIFFNIHIGYILIFLVLYFFWMLP